jgi:hypothetical protein
VPPLQPASKAAQAATARARVNTDTCSMPDRRLFNPTNKSLVSDVRGRRRPPSGSLEGRDEIVHLRVMHRRGLGEIRLRLGQGAGMLRGWSNSCVRRGLSCAPSQRRSRIRLTNSRGRHGSLPQARPGLLLPCGVRSRVGPRRGCRRANRARPKQDRRKDPPCRRGRPRQ